MMTNEERKQQRKEKKENQLLHIIFLCWTHFSDWVHIIKCFQPVWFTCNIACSLLSLNMEIRTSGSISVSCRAATSSRVSRIFWTASIPASSSAHSFKPSEAAPTATDGKVKRKIDVTTSPYSRWTFRERLHVEEIKKSLYSLPESMSVQHNGSNVTPLAIAWTAPLSLRRALKRLSWSTVSFKCWRGNFSRS